MDWWTRFYETLRDKIQPEKKKKSILLIGKKKDKSGSPPAEAPASPKKPDDGKERVPRLTVRQSCFSALPVQGVTLSLYVLPCLPRRGGGEMTVDVKTGMYLPRKCFCPILEEYLEKKYLFWKEYVSVMHAVTVTNRRDFRINLTCSGKSQAFEMPDLEFLPKF